MLFCQHLRCILLNVYLSKSEATHICHSPCSPFIAYECVFKSLTMTLSSSYRLCLCTLATKWRCRVQYLKHLSNKNADNGIINNTLTSAATRKNFLAHRCAFDDVSRVSTCTALNSEWDLTDCKVEAFRSFVRWTFFCCYSLSWKNSHVKRWTIIQIFIRLPLKVDATVKKGENQLPFYFRRIFFLFCSILLFCTRVRAIRTEKSSY